MVSFDLDQHAARVPLGQISEERGPVQVHAGSVAAVLAQLTLHFACFCTNISTLVVYFYFRQPHFFWTLFIPWLLAGCFVSWGALKELQPRGERNLRLLRWFWVIIVFGFLRGLQVRHILRFFKRRSAAHGSFTGAPAGERLQLMDPSAFNSKTFDGIIEGFFFALGNQFGFFLLDIDPPDCYWYMTEDFRGSARLRLLFLVSALCSMLTLAAAIVEVDYRVSTDIRWKINYVPFGAFIHFAYRASEVMIRLSLINLVCIFLRPQPIMQGPAGPYLLYVPIILIWLADVIILHRAAKRHGADQEFLLAHVAVALASITVNPTQFVDRPIYVASARRTAKAFSILRWIELFAMAAFVAWCWRTKFPEACQLQQHPPPLPPSSIGAYTLWWNSNHRMAYWELGLASFVHFAIIASQPYTRKVWNFQRHNSNRSEGVGALIAAEHDGDRLRAEVRRSVPRGLSSFLVQAGTGVTSRLFANKEYAVTDFVIEQVLGEGSYAVVVLVKALWCGGAPLPEGRQRHYALKLQNVSSDRGSDHWRKTYANREREYLVKLAEHKHPFIMRLEHFFDVPPDHQFLDVERRHIQDRRGNRYFDKALMMEYCPQGDLEAYLQRRALVAPSRVALPSEGVESLEGGLQWLVTARLLCAQLMEAVRFLHGENFTHRDLKPGNVLLKSGPMGLQVCLTDFGFAKQTLPNQHLESVAGNSEYMAPEIRTTWNAGLWVGPTYTSAVDLWSLGKMILVILWNAKFWYQIPGDDDGFWWLQTPSLEWLGGDEGHPRVPASARQLVQRMMHDSAELRGTASELVRHRFFMALEHRGVQLPALDFSNCRQAPVGM